MLSSVAVRKKLNRAAGSSIKVVSLKKAALATGLEVGDKALR